MFHSIVTLPHVTAIGIGATLLMNGWAILRKRLFGVPSLDDALIGRWVGHMPRGRFSHATIGKAALARPLPARRHLGFRPQE